MHHFLLVLAVAFAVAVPAQAADPAAAAKIHPSLRQASGIVDVVVRLKDKPLGAVLGRNIRRDGPRLSPAQQRAYLARLTRNQNMVLSRAAELGAGEQGRARLAANVVILTLDASKLVQLASHGLVGAVNPVVDYETDLTGSVPYIGGTAVHTTGNQGAGVLVAVLDSGVDYTHAAFGGAGTPAAYEAAYGLGPADPRNKTRDGLFPTSKVIEGMDFVGEAWPLGPLATDDDPIDFQGHGTHVADIIAGGQGVAPGASLLAVKVCSAVSAACSGIALFNGMEYVLDHDGNGIIDVIPEVLNMSLGASYGQIQDDIVLAVEVLSLLGVTVVASAGNSGDKPYVTGTPAASPSAISVAQTQMPGTAAHVLRLTGFSNRPVLRRNTASMEWAPVGSHVSGAVVHVGLACAPLTPGSLAGKIALIDRGSCSVSWKIDHAAKAGAVGVIIANNVAGDPPSFSFGGTSDGSTFLPVPALVITRTDGQLIKSALAKGFTPRAAFGPGLVTPVAGSMVASSSRGPAYGTQLIKPELGAPGASVSAVAGTGTGTAAFGGTSGAAPMVSGAAALVAAEYPGLAPIEVKARLMNAAHKDIHLNPTTMPGVLAPLTRIGAGEVRVADAIALKAVAYDAAGFSAALSFGFHTLHHGTANTFTRRVELRNYDAASRTYAIANLFRYANDAASGAVLVSAPPTVTVSGHGTVQFDVMLEVKPDKLPAWPLNIGPQGGNGPLLQTVEFDGHLVLTGTTDGEKLCVPWHILPRRSAGNTASPLLADASAGPVTITVDNAHGAQAGQTEVFHWIGESPLDYGAGAGIGANIALVDLQHVGVRTAVVDGTPFLQVAISTWDVRSHGVYPATFEVWFDKDADGTYDSAMYTQEIGSFASSGQTAAWGGPITDLGGGNYDFSAVTGPRTFVDGNLNSSVVVISMPLSVLGLADSSKVAVAVVAADNYFTGFVTDMIPRDDFYPPLRGQVFTLNQPHYTASAVQVTVPAGGSGVFTTDVNPPGAAASPDQLGLLLFHRQAVLGREVEAVKVTTSLP